jgi:hypothetical protein
VSTLDQLILVCVTSITITFEEGLYDILRDKLLFSLHRYSTQFFLSLVKQIPREKKRKKEKKSPHPGILHPEVKSNKPLGKGKGEKEALCNPALRIIPSIPSRHVAIPNVPRI